ncbi:DUF6292 family protein [Qaidamihabitans albus]|uniref:DUF6292 family protein n=1 Tax=Qaidamihabitans albus TaxID=2795733 RepID=UPI0018F17A06|nr:DUF6292 family protein [Qaidamihabitans albus]
MDTQPDVSWALRLGLAGYVRAVAVAADIPHDGTGFEISDTATAYLGLAGRWAEHPGHDLMLVWNERHGWSVAVETDPAEQPVVLAHLGGTDPVPDPQVVARFVADVVAGRWSERARPEFPAAENRGELSRRLGRYAT